MTAIRTLILALALGLAACSDPWGPPIVKVAVTPKTVSLPADTKTTFTAAVTGSSNTAVTWSVAEGILGGKVSTAGEYTAPSTPGTYHVVATSAADPTKSDSATATVTAPIAVTVSPKTVALQISHTATFTANVTGSINTAVTWSVQGGDANGSITAAGVYTAPAVAGVFTVVATSAADTTKTDTATVTVTTTPPVVQVSVSPKSAGVQVNGTVQFAAAVVNSLDSAVTWTVSPASGAGTISASGLYTAPASAGNATVIATSHADNTKSDSALVTITTTAPGSAPGVVGTLTASASCKTVTLNWVSPTSNPPANGYVVTRAAPPGNTYATVSTAARPGNATTFIDSDAAITANTNYSYQVYATNNGVPSSPATISATTGIDAPTWVDPNGGSTFLYAGDTQVSMQWDGTAIAGIDTPPVFVVSRATSAGGPFSTTVSTPPYHLSSITDHSGLSPSTQYFYEVHAMKGTTAGCSLTGNVTTGAVGSAITQKAGIAQTFIDVPESFTETIFVQDLATDTFFRAFSYSPGGTPTVYLGEGTADGYFTIPGVPAGSNYVNVNNGWLYTSTRQFDLSYIYFGRANPVYATKTTNVTTNVVGLAPWTTATDNLELFTIGGTSDYYLDASASSGAPTAGATNASPVVDFNGGKLLSTAQGDVLVIDDIANQASAVPFPYGTVQKTCQGTLNPTTLVDGSNATIACSSPFTTPGTAGVSLNWNRSSMKSLLLGANSSSTAGADSFYLIGFPAFSTHQIASGVEPTLLQLFADTGSTTVVESLIYGNPMAGNPHWGVAYQTAALVKVPETAQPTASCTGATTPSAGARNAYYLQWDAASTLGSQVTADVGVPSNVTTSNLTAVSGTFPSFGSGVPVQVSWTAPASGGAPTSYLIQLWPVQVDSNCKTVFTTHRSMRTLPGTTSAVLPPGFFETQDGSKNYIVQVYSVYNPNDPNHTDFSSPGLWFATVPAAEAAATSAAFAH